MNEDLLALIIIVFLAGAGLVIGLFAGTVAERRHYRSIRRRERELVDLMVLAERTVPSQMTPCRTQFVTGSVVVGMDYFKRFLAMLSNILGGRVHAYETLIDRGRREAILRMKEEASRLGARCVLNVKFNTANIMSGDRENSGAGCVEVIVYGTAVVPEG